MKIHDVVIIGAGPAGIAAAIQLKRTGVDPLLLEGDEPGGLLHNANLVENYPGFPGGISGPDLIELMVEQMRRWDVRHERAEVWSLGRYQGAYSDDARLRGGEGDGLPEGPRSSGTERVPFRIETDGEILHARFVVLASGTEGVVPDDFPLPCHMLGRRVFREIRDVSPRPSDRVAIVGGGDCALDYALNLAGRGCRVSILHRGDRPNALPLLVERMEVEPRVEYLPRVEVKAVEEVGDELVLELLGGEAGRLEIDYLLLAVGRRPRVGFVSREIRSDLDSGKGVEGLHLAGDVRRGAMRQVGIAVGDGLLAAMEIGAGLKE